MPDFSYNNGNDDTKNKKTQELKSTNSNTSHRLDIESVENEILRQILYSSLSKNIPISLISKFKEDKKTIFVSSLFFCVLILFFLFFSYSSKTLVQSAFELFFESHFYSICACVDLIFCVYSVFVYLGKKFKISNLSFQSIGVNVNDNELRIS